MDTEDSLIPKPKCSKYIIHSAEQWTRICEQRNKPMEGLEGFYTIRNQTAHLRQESIFLDLCYYHEYIGHGGFIEYSKTGEKLLNYELELMRMENKNQHKLYPLLLQEYQDYLDQTYDKYEGYAYWLEYYMAEQNSMQDLYNLKLKLLHKHNIELVHQYNDFVKENSLTDLLEVVFKRSV